MTKSQVLLILGWFVDHIDNERKCQSSARDLRKWYNFFLISHSGSQTLWILTMDLMGVHRLQWRTDIVHRSHITYCVQGLAFYLFIWILVPQPEIKPSPLHCELIHWTSKEVQRSGFLKKGPAPLLIQHKPKSCPWMPVDIIMEASPFLITGPQCLITDPETLLQVTAILPTGNLKYFITSL